MLPDELKKEHWYCTTCKERKEPISATYGETCEDCGTTLIYVYNWMKNSGRDEELQDFINVLDDAIRYLENHHYNTAKLIESTQKILGTYDKKE